MAKLPGFNQFLINGGVGSPGLPPLNPLSGKFGIPPTGTTTLTDPLVISSGLYDVSQPKYPLRFKPGIPNRHYRYVGPLVTLTDTFSGSLILSSRAGATTSNTVDIVMSASTLDQWAANINSRFGTFCVAKVVKYGTTGYLVIDSIEQAIPGDTTDVVLTMTPSITDDKDPYLNFNFVPLISNGMALQGTGTWQWAVGFRDPITGHLSNMSPVARISNLSFASEVNLTIQASSLYNTLGYVMEVYRTAQDGSSLLFIGLADHLNNDIFGNSTYGFRDTFTDDFLNPGLVGPIDEENDPPPTGIYGLVQHSGRLWGIVKNRIYYSGGADTTNGNGYESWPPSNYFEYPGTPQLLLSTAQGLQVFLSDDIHLVSGVDTASFYSDLWLAGFGISNAQAAVYDGQTSYIYTTKQQLHAISPKQQNEIGFDIGDQLAAKFPAATSNLTIHRGSSLDFALYLSNGTDSIFRYDPRQKSWSTISNPLMGSGRVKSLESAIGVNTLLLGTPAGRSPGIFQRSLSIWLDNGTPYPAFATIGTMLVAEPGQTQTFDHVALQLLPRGTMPNIWVLNNELDPTVVPFIELHNPVPDPPELPAAKTLWSRRWYLKSAQVMVPMVVQTVQLKIQFATENAKNEVLGVYLRNRS